jgi:HD superfamily phosphodiesterase
MKLTHKQFKQIEEFAKRKMEKNDISHKLPHILRTANISKKLATIEKADVTKCIIVAWLHDIEKNKEELGMNHGDEGAKSAREFLKGIGLGEKDIEEIAYAIKQHNKDGPHKTIETKIIWDADKLPNIGMEGIIRIYGHYLTQGNSIEESYKKAIEEQKLYCPRFKTKTGRKFANKRFKFLIKMIKEYKKEINLKK